MKFSVLISVYDKEKPVFLEKALSSIVNQTLMPSEIVLVKDGPISEPLEKVIDWFTSAYPDLFNIVSLSINRGLGEALRIGVEVCKYEHIARMDSDDICHPDRFEKQVSFMKTHPDIAVLGSNIEEFNIYPGDNKVRRLMPESGKKLLNYAKFRSPVNHPSILMRKQAVINAGNYNGNIRLWEDYSLFIRMLKNGSKFYNMQEILLYFRVGSGIESIERRSGYNYMKNEWKFACLARQVGHLSNFDWFLYVVLKLPLRLLPTRLVLYLYQRFLRH